MHGQGAKRTESRKGNVQEESDGLGNPERPQSRRQRDQVIVMNPDQIVRPQQRHGALRETLIHLQIGCVLLLRIMEGLQEIMKQRPQGTVTESQVELIVLSLGEVEGRVGKTVAAYHLNFPTIRFAIFFAVVLPVSWLLMPVHDTREPAFQVTQRLLAGLGLLAAALTLDGPLGLNSGPAHTLVLVLAGWGGQRWLSPGARGAGEITATVTRTDLPIVVTERGQLESAKTVTSKCEVEGESCKIVFLLAEGTHVKKGEVVVRFDSDKIRRGISEQEIKFKTANGKAKAAKEELDVQKNKAETEIAKAELALALAKLDREKYLEGEYKVEVDDKKGAINVDIGYIGMEEKHFDTSWQPS